MHSGVLCYMGSSRGCVWGAWDQANIDSPVDVEPLLKVYLSPDPHIPAPGIKLEWEGEGEG